MEGLTIERKGGATLRHPWFGPLSAFQWLCLSATHMRIHRQQIERILEVSREIDAEQDDGAAE
jgi:hypothetical protein